MKADVKWFCTSALLSDWIWILTYSTEGVLVTASCNYTTHRSLKTGFPQPNATRYKCSHI